MSVGKKSLARVANVTSQNDEQKTENVASEAVDVVKEQESSPVLSEESKTTEPKAKPAVKRTYKKRGPKRKQVTASKSSATVTVRKRRSPAVKSVKSDIIGIGDELPIYLL